MSAKVHRLHRFLRPACLVVSVLSLAPGGLAHRLDEYLQATRISVGLSRIGIEIDLTPGVAVAESVFSAIDTDHDSNVSAAEAAAYAHDLVGALALTVDDRAAPLRLNEYQFPTFEEMRRGEGVIRLRATSDLQPAEPGQHHITFMNTYRRDIGVYLVNALASGDSRIHVTNQSRDSLQREFSMDYVVSASEPAQNLRIAAVLLLLAAACYGLTRRALA